MKGLRANYSPLTERWYQLTIPLITPWCRASSFHLLLVFGLLCISYINAAHAGRGLKGVMNGEWIDGLKDGRQKREDRDGGVIVQWALTPPSILTGNSSTRVCTFVCPLSTEVPTHVNALTTCTLVCYWEKQTKNNRMYTAPGCCIGCAYMCVYVFVLIL